MKIAISLLAVTVLFAACQSNQVEKNTIRQDFSSREVTLTNVDSLVEGKTYLSVYSKIYCQNELRTQDLTITASLRNTSLNDTVYLTSALLYDTHGAVARNYIQKPIYISPMETIEIVIDEQDAVGGTGGNFLFDWKKYSTSNDPIFEAVMISTTGQQGLSFATQGIKLNE